MIKLILRMSVLILLSCALVPKASAYDFKVDGIYYNILSKEDRTVEVTESSDDKYKGDITIPKKIISNSLTYTVTSIGYDAFKWCSSLTSVTIPNSVTSIGYYAFGECSSLTSVTIGNSVTSIGDYAFYECSSLTSVTIPNSVTSIGYYAFGRCSRLTSVTIPNSVTSIEEGAFSRCSRLTSVNIPNSVTSIGYRAFESCNKLTAIVVDDNNEHYCSIKGVLFNKSCDTIICLPCGYSGNYNIPSTVTSIERGAFYDCSKLTSVTIPNSVTYIGGAAFSGCSSLTSVTIPNSVTSIGGYAFSRCSRLTSVNIPNSVTYIGDAAFFECHTLSSIYCMWDEPIYCKPSFSDSVLKDATLYVPKGTISKYEAVDPWRNFWNIEEFVYSGVDSVEDSAGVDFDVYSLSGVKLFHAEDEAAIKTLPSGVYILRYSNGTYRKVVI